MVFENWRVGLKKLYDEQLAKDVSQAVGSIQAPKDKDKTTIEILEQQIDELEKELAFKSRQKKP